MGANNVLGPLRKYSMAALILHITGGWTSRIVTELK